MLVLGLHEYFGLGFCLRVSFHDNFETVVLMEWRSFFAFF